MPFLAHLPMRSICYLLGWGPKNLDDCFDVALQELPHSVTMELHTKTMLLPDSGFYQENLYGKFHWEFPDQEVQYQKWYGAYLQDQGNQDKGVTKANGRLTRDLQKIQSLEISVLGSELRFQLPE
jgi:hypothetical protein